MASRLTACILHFTQKKGSRYRLDRKPGGPQRWYWSYGEEKFFFSHELNPGLLAQVSSHLPHSCFLLVRYSAMKLEMVRSSATSFNLRTTQSNVPEDCNIREIYRFTTRVHWFHFLHYGRLSLFLYLYSVSFSIRQGPYERTECFRCNVRCRNIKEPTNGPQHTRLVCVFGVHWLPYISTTDITTYVAKEAFCALVWPQP
jgi:hypothetical protein